MKKSGGNKVLKETQDASKDLESKAGDSKCSPVE